MTKNDVTTVSGNVRLKSESGRSMRNETNIPTKENIKYFRPSKETMNKAIQELQKLGFTVPEADFCEKCKFPLKTITIINIGWWIKHTYSGILYPLFWYYLLSFPRSII